MKLELQIYGSRALRQKARPIESIDRSIRRLVADMLDTMHLEKGIGLAAQQVGSDLAVCVVEVPAEYDKAEDGNLLNPAIKMPLVLINPEILQESDEQCTMEEGCLSFPGIYFPITRPSEVTVRFRDLSNEDQEVHCRGLLARAVQHEIDHLNGVLIVDRAPPLKRAILLPKLLQLRRAGTAQTSPVPA